MMSQLVSGFVADADGVKVDAARNAMVVRGPGPKREEAVRAILAFDADWMRGQSVSLFEVRRARPETIVAELSQIFDNAENGAGAGVIQFKPITRLRAVLAISKNPGPDQQGGQPDQAARRRERQRRGERLRLPGALPGRKGAGAHRQHPVRGRRRRPEPGRERRGRRRPALDPGEPGHGGKRVRLRSGQRRADVLGRDLGARPDDRRHLRSGFRGEDGAAGGGADAPLDTIDLTRQGPGGPTRVSVSADASNNSVITYADGETYKKIQAALIRLDSSPLQVAVNVMIAEVQLNEQLRYGIQYFVGSDRIGAGTDKGSVSLFSQAATAIQKQVPGFNFLAGTAATPDIIVNALDDITDVQVLSSPSLVVLENQTATLQVGDAVPITTRQAQSIENPAAPLLNQIEFRDTGIILSVTPRIGQNDAVTMQIEQEISSVTSAADTLTPTISKRKVASAISVVSGQTVLLAGLISEKRQKGRGGIPVLGQVPGLGACSARPTTPPARPSSWCSSARS
jgi:general secretion pathway protein D